MRLVFVLIVVLNALKTNEYFIECAGGTSIDAAHSMEVVDDLSYVDAEPVVFAEDCVFCSFCSFVVSWLFSFDTDDSWLFCVLEVHCWLKPVCWQWNYYICNG